ncbi:phage protein [Tetragenococcus muriaticus PMC-11-5]|uniref:Phage protein n=1 Tax=Tetragenococcus muriaticus PMC-11-5 TaxID=1302649 RepID=A0A091C9S8_9ENTE|nr:phage protein [Tetragenococcus muriaticus PMC-11-5]
MMLEAEGYDDEELLKPQQLQSITNLEKVVGKKAFNDLASDYIIKPDGKPVLVPESDKRSALNSVDDAISDFEGG